MKQFLAVAETNDGWVSYGCYNTAKSAFESLEDDYDVIGNSFAIELDLPTAKKSKSKIQVIKVKIPKEKN